MAEITVRSAPSSPRGTAARRSQAAGSPARPTTASAWSQGQHPGERHRRLRPIKPAGDDHRDRPGPGRAGNRASPTDATGHPESGPATPSTPSRKKTESCAYTRRDGGCVAIDVEDNGEGIPRPAGAHSRTRSSTKRAGQGARAWAWPSAGTSSPAWARPSR